MKQLHGAVCFEDCPASLQVVDASAGCKPDSTQVVGQHSGTCQLPIGGLAGTANSRNNGDHLLTSVRHTEAPCLALKEKVADTGRRQPLPGFGKAPAVTETPRMYTASSPKQSHNPAMGRSLGGNCSVGSVVCFPPVFRGSQRLLKGAKLMLRTCSQLRDASPPIRRC